MTDLDPVEPGGDERLEPLASAFRTRMRQHGDAAGRMDHRDPLGDLQALLVHVSRAARTEETVERLARVAHKTADDQCLGHMRTADRATVGDSQHAVERDGDTEHIELVHDRERTRDAAVPVEHEVGLHPRDVADVQAEQMHLVIALMHAELDAGHESQPERIGSDLRFGHPAERVVVGERERGETGAMRGLDGDGGTLRSIGRGGMRVQVHEGRGGCRARLTAHDA